MTKFFASAKIKRMAQINATTESTALAGPLPLSAHWPEGLQRQPCGGQMAKMRTTVRRPVSYRWSAPWGIIVVAVVAFHGRCCRVAGQ